MIQDIGAVRLNCLIEALAEQSEHQATTSETIIFADTMNLDPDFVSFEERKRLAFKLLNPELEENFGDC